MIDHDRMAEALPGYDIGEELGRGAFGVVFGAQHRRLNREVAVKQLPRAFGADPDVRARFVAEAQLLAEFDHPHIVKVYDYVEHEGLCLLVMERLTGGSLADRHRASPVDPRQACAVALAAATALECAHSQGVLHRDVKPENLMFSRRGTLKVTDFGIAKVIVGSGSTLTQPGIVLGTPAFMAPEQAEGAAGLTPATDVYALALVLFELLAGTLPFPDEQDPVAALYQRVHHRPRSLAEAESDVPSGVSAVVDRALAREPGERYPSAEAFGVALGRAATANWGPGWLDGTGIELHGTGPVVATLTPAGEVPVHRADEPPVDASVRRAPTLASPVVARRRPRWRRSPRVLVGAGVGLLLLAAAALLTFAGDGEDGPTPTATVESTTTAVTVAPAPLPARQGPLEPGSYMTTKLQPSVSFTIGDGWEKLGETGGTLALARVDAPGQSLDIMWVNEVVDPGADLRTGDGLQAHVVPAPPPVQLPSWIRTHPRLTTQDATGVPRSRLRGLVLDLTVRDGYEFDGCDRPCVVLFPHLAEDSAVAAFDGDRNRVAIFTVGERALVVLMSGGATEGADDYFSEASAVVASLHVEAPS